MPEPDSTVVIAAQIAAVVACVIGGGLGLYGMINPGWVARLVRLAPLDNSLEGKSEFRATYGGLFFASHAVVLWAVSGGVSGSALAAAVLAAAWAGSAVGRTISFAADRSATGLNVFNVAFELVLAGGLVAPMLVGL